MKMITVVVTPEGNVTIEAHGFTGGMCTQATAELEKALGAPGKRTKKPDFYKQQVQQAQQGH